VADAESPEALLYTQTVAVATVYWEWRHKVMLLFPSLATAFVLGAGWMYEHDFGRLVAIPFAIAAVITVIAFVLELRNKAILKECFQVAYELEKTIRAASPTPATPLAGPPATEDAAGIFGRIVSRNSDRWGSKVLPASYLTLAIGLIAATVIVILRSTDHGSLKAHAAAAELACYGTGPCRSINGVHNVGAGIWLVDVGEGGARNCLHVRVDAYSVPLAPQRPTGIARVPCPT
jgi:hypothetical protein